MTPQQIKDSAPEGATHYECSCVVDYIINYWRLQNKTWHWWHNNEWKPYPFGNADANDLKPL